MPRGHKAPDRDSEEDLFISKLSALGGSAGNITMMKELKWPEADYWPIRDRLLDQGVIELGRGKGGSVRLSEEASGSLGVEKKLAEEVKKAPIEAQLYDPLAKVLRNEWARDKRFQDHIVEITANGGRKHTRGPWTRPDLTVLAMTAFTYLPGKHFDVITFEVKPYVGMHVSAVYEAVAHRRASNRSYVILHVPEQHQEEELVKSMLGEIQQEAKRHGVGLIVVGNPNDYGTWDERADALRYEPTPERLNEFLAVQMTADTKEQIVKWFK